MLSVVELGEVSVLAGLWHVWWVDVVSQKLGLVDVGESLMGEDLLGVTLCTKSLVLILKQKILDQVHNIVGVLDLVLFPVWEHDLCGLNLLHQHVSIWVEEWSDSNKHLVGQDTDGPPIDVFVMTGVGNHLWGKILWGTTETCGLLLLLQHLSETIINDLKISGVVKKNVLQFEISMDNTFLVEVSNGLDDLRSIEENGNLVESLLLLVNLVELTTLNEWHDEIKSHLVLKDVVHTNQEWVVALEHDLFFEDGAVNLVHLDKDILSNGFDGILLIVLLWEFSQEHLSECSSSKHHDHLEIFKIYIVLGVVELLVFLHQRGFSIS